MKLFLHFSLIILLTALTQVGGLIYLITLLLIKNRKAHKKLKFFGLFTGLYLLTTFLIVPYLAPLFGREKINDSHNLEAHSFFYELANRNYVRPELHQALHEIATEYGEEHQGIKLIYLDACFPFFDKFPLLPHLSHNDGKKVDVSLIYEELGNQLTNKKPSRSGYGVWEGPANEEFDQAAFCRDKGYWQYDFPQYLSLGKINTEISFSARGTRNLVKLIVKQSEIGKLFIEPHLKSRLNLTSSKIRFHGCQAVRHDDHIHFQLN